MDFPSKIPVKIYLEKGGVFRGMGFGDFSEPRMGEFVFCTAMSGIEESLTDPSFAGQVIVNTVSHVGNTGFTGEDMESDRIWAEGLVTRHLETIPSNWRAKNSIPNWLIESKKFAVSGVDTRALTIDLREKGSQRGLVVADSAQWTPAKALQEIKARVPSMEGHDLTGTVSSHAGYAYSEDSQNSYWPVKSDLELKAPASKAKIAVWDFGVKKNTLRMLTALGAEVFVLPATAKADEILAAGRDGILLSNGPGDPAAATHVIGELKQILARNSGPQSLQRQIFAICLGHQLVACAVGAKTYKMKFGHRGIHHPVMQINEKNEAIRTWITSQNHGFAVDRESLPKDVRASFLHADDESVEGLSLPSLFCETVQFHPEAAPGPTDSCGLIKSFMIQVRSRVKSDGERALQI